MNVGATILLIVGDPQGILDQQRRHHLIPLLNIIVILISFIIIKIFKSLTEENLTLFIH
jgi:hypothetical protein